ncbi:DUF2383 domain-containing protein [Pelagicoccus enzymogenes]|uniref:DUF2383 domain-containing protein n=1 Tax=Pelagicoccus enzymogenes TaxID=2773457 RepID=UPI00280D89F1|nr:DUF2383 domain-containing protein [Pelagicoccus enzymogenes]MDQ8199990.1 DUF2383 domain-containing protein [Pelagicoccus enzymogenes]
MKTTEINQTPVDICNQLLRGEMSAVETYGKAIEKFAREPEATVFIQIRDLHERSVEQLRSQVELMSGVPSDSSGSWGMLVNAVQATANVMGKGSALEVLKRGEVYGMRDYEEALGKSDLDEASSKLIRDVLLPRCRENIVALDQLDDS